MTTTSIKDYSSTYEEIERLVHRNKGNVFYESLDSVDKEDVVTALIQDLGKDAVIDSFYDDQVYMIIAKFMKDPMDTAYELRQTIVTETYREFRIILEELFDIALSNFEASRSEEDGEPPEDQEIPTRKKAA